MEKIYVRIKDSGSNLSVIDTKPKVNIHKLPVLIEKSRQVQNGIQVGALVEVQKSEVQGVFDRYKVVNPYAIVKPKDKLEKLLIVEDDKQEDKELNIDKVANITEILEKDEYQKMKSLAIELKCEGINVKSNKEDIKKALKELL